MARFIPFDIDRTVPWETASWDADPATVICLAALAAKAVKDSRRED
jgi:hypothetical protein